MNTTRRLIQQWRGIYDDLDSEIESVKFILMYYHPSFIHPPMPEEHKLELACREYLLSEYDK